MTNDSVLMNHLLLASYYSLLTTHYSLLTTDDLLLTTYYSLPTAYYSLLTTYYELRTMYSLQRRLPLQPPRPTLSLCRGGEGRSSIDGISTLRMLSPRLQGSEQQVGSSGEWVVSSG